MVSHFSVDINGTCRMSVVVCETYPGVFEVCSIICVEHISRVHQCSYAKQIYSFFIPAAKSRLAACCSNYITFDFKNYTVLYLNELVNTTGLALIHCKIISKNWTSIFEKIFKIGLKWNSVHSLCCVKQNHMIGKEKINGNSTFPFKKLPTIFCLGGNMLAWIFFSTNTSTFYIK